MRAVCHICGAGPASGSAKSGFLCKAHEHVALNEASSLIDLDRQARNISTTCTVDDVEAAKSQLQVLAGIIHQYSDAQLERAQAIINRAQAILDLKSAGTQT